MMSQQEEEQRWDAAVLFSTNVDGASLYRMKIDKDNGQLVPAGVHLKEPYTAGMGFALLNQHHLYAFGRIPKIESPDFFVCDLKCKGTPPVFRKAGRLLGPKASPMVIPVGKNKIVIISTGVRRPEGYIDPPHPPYCEILYLPKREGGAYRSEGIRTPWDDTYGTYFGCSPMSMGHVVLGDNVYVHIMAGPWDSKSSLYVLNMTTRQWSICPDPSGYCYTGDPRVSVAPLPLALDPVFGHWRSFNHIVKGILFSVVVDPVFDDPNKPKKKIFVGAMSLKDLAGLDHPRNRYRRPRSVHDFIPSLEKLENFMATEYSGYAGGKGWVMPLQNDRDDNKLLFALFLCFEDRVEFNEHLLACKFELFDRKPKDGGGHVAAAPNGKSSSCGYDCNILSHALYLDCFPHNAEPLCIFTGAADYRVLM